MTTECVNLPPPPFKSALRAVDADPAAPRRGLVAFFLSGAGGWIAFDRHLARDLAAAGIDVVGVSSLRYFLWRRRTPDEIAAATEQVLRQRLAGHPNDKILLIGYSQGADVMPFVARRLSSELKRRLELMVLIGPASAADFRLRLRDIIFGTYSPDAQLLLPEIEAVEVRILCIQGESDASPMLGKLTRQGARTYTVPGGHVFRSQYRAIARLILRHLAGTSAGWAHETQER